MNSTVMGIEELRALLKKEEERRRREAKKRQRKIEALMLEQIEHKGKLWDEIPISVIAKNAYNTEGERGTDTEARICADINPEEILNGRHLPTPVRQCILQEAIEIAKKTIITIWGEAGWKFFQLWLDAPVHILVEEINESSDNSLDSFKLSPRDTMEMIKSMVYACRKNAGMETQIFPFPEEQKKVRELGKRLRLKIGKKRSATGKANPADPENRIYLSVNEIVMPLDTLREHIKEEYGITISRTTAYWAKKRGWFMKPGWKRGGFGEKVLLDSDDRKKKAREIAEKYGISTKTAKKALQRGYFHKTSQNKIKPKKEEEEKKKKKSQAKIKEVAGRKICDLSIKEIQEKFSLCERVAYRVKKRGYLTLKRLTPNKKMELAKRIENIEKNGW